MKMFCGLPVIVPAEPMLAAVARPIRCGTGSYLRRGARCRTSGVRATHTTSLMRNADSPPDRTITAASSPTGPRTRARAKSVSRRKKPESRNTPTTTIMPNSRNSVSKSRAAARVCFEKSSSPQASISAAPTSATPARSTLRPGTLPSASPT